MPTVEELEDEARRARKVRQFVDIATTLIMQATMTRSDAEALAHWVREQVLDLFPGRESTYDLIYAPRFRRLIAEFTRPSIDRRSVILPFQRTNG